MFYIIYRADKLVIRNRLVPGTSLSRSLKESNTQRNLCFVSMCPCFVSLLLFKEKKDYWSINIFRSIHQKINIIQPMLLNTLFWEISIEYKHSFNIIISQLHHVYIIFIDNKVSWWFIQKGHFWISSNHVTCFINLALINSSII